MPEATLAIAEEDIRTLDNLLPIMPKHIDSVQKAVATMLVARDLNVPFMTSVGDLMVVNGTVGMTSKMMLALVHRAGHRTKVIEMTEERASIEGFRRYDGEWESVGVFEFTYEQAERANLTSKDTYELYTEDMLMNKAIARMVRFGFSDVLRGYVPDEMEDITGITVDHSMHLGPTEEALTVEEVVEELDAEVVES